MSAAARGVRERVRKPALAAEIVVAYFRVRLALRRGDLHDAVNALGAGAPAPGGVAVGDAVATGALAPGDAVAAGRRLGRAVVRTLEVLPTDSRCLMRSLVLTRLLARRGIASRLVLGVRPADPLEAHAWVEHAAQPLLDPGDGRFERLLEL